ncbi:YIP1 family protein [Amylibacter sp. IMCC11727]|uniref:YIP1 family protein n=1 Tax=Amylibacter sp. IMCC11727 TaxID=3039851 RepID=UPI00244DBA2A|nr:YIP1 family protein [Amylibacter sp. IMCC11727]WGI20407.1 hypothetical protein QBD29_09770 [Amylibacter sp. IMCC11727]
MTPQRLIDFLLLAVQSLTQPREAVRALLPLARNTNAVILAGAIVVVFGTIILLAADATIPKNPNGPEPLFQLTIYQNIMLIAAGLPITAAVMTFVGRMFSGTGTFYECLTGVIWHNFLTYLAMIAMVIGALLSQLLGALLFLGAMAYMLVQFVSITSEVHGFKNPFLVTLGIIGTYLVIAFALSIILLLLGVEPMPLPEPT